MLTRSEARTKQGNLRCHPLTFMYKVLQLKPLPASFARARCLAVLNDIAFPEAVPSASAGC